jgi:hypothetical protein
MLATVLVLVASARPASADPADQEAIDRAIKLGKNYLLKQQKPAGFWGDGTGPGSGKGWGVGYTALAGMALLECGVPSTDPVIKKAANIVRTNVHELDDTYELALAILFLDRMKDSADKPRIQWLAGRLIAAQMPSGGWGYKATKYSQANTTQLLAALRKLQTPTVPPADPLKVRATLPENMRRLAVFTDEGVGRLPADAKEKRHDLIDATTDNSNTHFAMIGLWTARKHDVPTDRTFALVNRRFRTSQGAGGTWGYDFVPTGGDGGGPHTCIALLGVAIGHVVNPPAGIKPEADPVILNAFVALSKSVGEPAGTTENRPKIKDVGGLYYLWAMERIAVLYDLQKLGKKDWYLWGAEILLCHQNADGSWEEGGYPGESQILNTCFALMFLRRANLTPDLSKRLVVDPSALAAKVDDKVAPKVEPPPPTPKEPEPIAVAPMPHTVEPKKEPPPKVTPTPPAPAPVAQPEAPAAPAVAKKTPWLWIVLGTLLAAVAGGFLAFVLLKRKRDADDGEDAAEVEEEENPKKKKKKPKVEADDD